MTLHNFNYILNSLDQFSIRSYISLDAPVLAYTYIFITNIAIYLTIATIITLIVNILATNYNKVVSNGWSLSQKLVYTTVHSIVINQINAKKWQLYFCFIHTLFIFILINNLIGMILYNFASTSHLILIFSNSFTIVLVAIILGLTKLGFNFFSLFVLAGCLLSLLFLFVLIEFILYIAKNILLGLRLAVNILNSHILLNILSGFAYNILLSGFIYIFVGLISLVFIIAFSGLELSIAFIQSQVFVVLTSSYIKDAIDLY